MIKGRRIWLCVWPYAAGDVVEGLESRREAHETVKTVEQGTLRC